MSKITFNSNLIQLRSFGPQLAQEAVQRPHTPDDDDDAYVIDPNKIRPLQDVLNGNELREAPDMFQAARLPVSTSWIMSVVRDRELHAPRPPHQAETSPRCAGCHHYIDFDHPVGTQGFQDHSHIWELRCRHVMHPECLAEIASPRPLPGKS